MPPRPPSARARSASAFLVLVGLPCLLLRLAPSHAQPVLYASGSFKTVNGTRVVPVAFLASSSSSSSSSELTAAAAASSSSALTASSSWTALPPLNASYYTSPVWVNTVVVDPAEGVLHAAGSYVSAGSSSTNEMRWNADVWTPDSNGVPSATAYAAARNGSLYMATTATTASLLMRWNGTAQRWADAGARSIYDRANALLALDDGRIVATGRITGSLGTTAASVNHLAVWDGIAWAPLGGGLNSSAPTQTAGYALAVYAGAIVVGGYFSSAGGTAGLNNVGVFTDGSGGGFWTPLGAGVDESVRALAVGGAAAELLFAAGTFARAGGAPANRIAVWNGTAWAPLGTGVAGGYVVSLAWFDGALFVAGTFTSAGGIAATKVARWDGAAWASLDGSINDGDVSMLYVGCLAGWAGPSCVECAPSFFGPTCTPCTRCATTGVCESGLGGRCVCNDGYTGAVCDQCVPDRYGPSCLDCAVCRVHGVCQEGRSGNCTCSLGWTGETCGQCATGWQGPQCADCQPGYFGSTCTSCLICNYHGRCQEGRSGQCDCDDGWAGPTCAICTNATVCGYTNRRVYVGGSFQTFATGLRASNIVMYDGQAWQGLDLGAVWNSPPVSVNAIVATDVASDGSGGMVYVGGSFTLQGSNGVVTTNIARWDGTQWLDMRSGANSGPVNALALDGTDLYVGGSFYSVGPANNYTFSPNLALWRDGAGWVAMKDSPGNNVRALVVAQVGASCDLYVGGDFINIGSYQSAIVVNYIARWSGSAWSPLGTGVGGVVAELAAYEGALLVAGYFTTAGGAAVPGNLARWDGERWSGLANTPSAPQTYGLLWHRGSIVAARTVGRATLQTLYLDQWAPLAGPMPTNDVLALTSNDDPYGVVVVTDRASNGGAASCGVSRWDGTNWTCMISPILSQYTVHLYAVSIQRTSNDAPPAFAATCNLYQPPTASDASLTTAIVLGVLLPLVALVLAGGLFFILFVRPRRSRSGRHAAEDGDPKPRSASATATDWLAVQPGVDASVVRRAVWRAWVGDVDDALAILTTAAAVVDGVRTVSNGSAAAATSSMTAALLQAAQADLLWQAHRTDEALRLYESALSALPRPVAARAAARLGQARLVSGALADALPFLSVALDCGSERQVIADASPAAMQGLLRSVPPPRPNGWTTRLLPVAAATNDDDPLVRATTATMANARIIRQWRIETFSNETPVRIVAAATRTRLHVWVDAGERAPRRLLDEEQGDDMTFRHEGLRFAVQRDRKSSLRVILGGPSMTLYCNGRSCENGAPYLTMGEKVSTCKYVNLTIVASIVYLVGSAPLMLALFYGIGLSRLSTWAAMAVGAVGSVVILLVIAYGLKVILGPKTSPICPERTARRSSATGPLGPNIAASTARSRKPPETNMTLLYD